jgi:CubicO group peptidase (beta-lactamase class C family)
MTLRHAFSFLALVTLAASCASAPPAGESTPPAPAAASPGARTADALDLYLQRTVPFGFSGTVLIAKGGDILVHSGYGLADRESSVPVTRETVFDIGSITKQFTAAAILELEEQGRLRTTDSISRFFPDVPADKRGITVHHLLTHSSGFQGDFGGDYAIMPRDSLVGIALASELQWAPGTRYDYSNTGYSLLGAIIEIASGQPYERFLHDHLFRPAGMMKTGYTIPSWTKEELAVGYRGGQRWGSPLDHRWAPDGPWWHLRANGGILTTLADLYRWHRALETDLVLSAPSRAKMFTPHVAESPEGDSHYGYGWAVFTTPRNTRLIAHNGGNGYFYAEFERYVDEDVVILLATNHASGPAQLILGRLRDAVFGGTSPAAPPAVQHPLTPDAAQRYAGSYHLPSGARLVVTVQDGLPVVDAHGQDAVELLAGRAVGEPEASADHTRRATTIIAAFVDGDLEPLREGSADFTQSRTILERIRRTAEENMGALRGHEVLGTVRSWWSDRSSSATFVRLDFERGSRLFRMHWNDAGRLTGFGGMAIPNPARTTLVPQAEHAFTGYNLGIEREVPVSFRVNASGTVEALVIRTPQGEQVARRVGG